MDNRNLRAFPLRPIENKKHFTDNSAGSFLDVIDEMLRRSHQIETRRLYGFESAEFQVNNFTSGNQYFPAIAALTDGGFVITWQSAGQDGSGFGVYAQRYTSAGARYGSELQVNTDITNDQFSPKVAGLTDGGFVIVWTSQRHSGSGYGVYGQRYTAVNTKVDSEFEVSTQAASVPFESTVAALANGSFVVAWPNLVGNSTFCGNIYGQMYNAANVKNGAQFLVSANVSDPTACQVNPAVARLSNGGFVITWQYNNGQVHSGYGVYGRIYTEAGIQVGSEFSEVNSRPVNSAVAGLAGGEFVVAWNSQGASTIFGRRYSAIGNAQGSTFQISTGQENVPAVAGFNDGTFVVAWQGSQVFGQNYTESGQKNGGQFVINAVTTASQVSRIYIAALVGGGYVVTWASSNDGSSYGVYARRFMAVLPTMSPTDLPTFLPSEQPTPQPTDLPTFLPSGQPTPQPTNWPTLLPSAWPTSQPTNWPTLLPSAWPTSQPTNRPTLFPSAWPTSQPTNKPTLLPSAWPTTQPTNWPTLFPSAWPTSEPTNRPTLFPSAWPTSQPTNWPTLFPSAWPTSQPTNRPTLFPFAWPTSQPTNWPTFLQDESGFSTQLIIGLSASGLVAIFVCMAIYFRRQFVCNKKKSAYESASVHSADMMEGEVDTTSIFSINKVTPFSTAESSCIVSGAQEAKMSAYSIVALDVITEQLGGENHLVEEFVEPINQEEVPGSSVHESALRKNDFTVEAHQPLSIERSTITLGEKLGKGGFGAVYEAEWRFQTVAVKCYVGDKLPQRIAREVRQEVGIMLRLQHDCLIRFHGLVYEEDSPPMLVMEYAAGGSLYFFLQSDEEISWNLRLRIALEIARGLAYLHAENIIHADLKSLNVVLTEDRHAKLCDFGLAQLRLHSQSTIKNVSAKEKVRGTLCWMAPELFSRETSYATQASDIWALGMVLFEIAHREVPFKDARDNDQLKDWIKEGTGEVVSEKSVASCPGFGEVMKRCWMERRSRPSAADIVGSIRDLTVTTFSQPLLKEEPAKNVNLPPLKMTSSFHQLRR